MDRILRSMRSTAVLSKSAGGVQSLLSAGIERIKAYTAVSISAARGARRNRRRAAVLECSQAWVQGCNFAYHDRLACGRVVLPVCPRGDHQWRRARAGRGVIIMAAESEAAHEHFVANGWLQVPRAITGGCLERLQRECARVEQDTRADWLRHVRQGTQPPHHRGSPADGWGPTHHVVYPVMAEGDIFPELLAHPIILRTLTRFLGPDFAMSDNGLCIKPPRMPSHVGWHRDATTWDWSRAEMDERWTAADRRFWEAHRARPCTAPMAKIKVMIFVEDIDAETAPFAVVPGSHRINQGRTYVDQAGNAWDATEGQWLEDPTLMPGHEALVGAAGSILFWNGALYHAAMANSHPTASRRLLLYNFVHTGPGSAVSTRPPELRVGRTQVELERWVAGLETRQPGHGPHPAVLAQLLGLGRAPRELILVATDRMDMERAAKPKM